MSPDAVGCQRRQFPGPDAGAFATLETLEDTLEKAIIREANNEELLLQIEGDIKRATFDVEHGLSARIRSDAAAELKAVAPRQAQHAGRADKAGTNGSTPCSSTGICCTGDPDTLIIPLRGAALKGRFHMVKDVFDASRAKPKPDALDVLRLEDDIASLEARKGRNRAKTFLVPGQKRKALDEVQLGLGRLRQALLADKEHVAYNAEQSARFWNASESFAAKSPLKSKPASPEAVKQQRLAAEIAKARAGLPETEANLSRRSRTNRTQWRPMPRYHRAEAEASG